MGSFVAMTVLARTTFTHRITLKQDLIQQVTIRGNINQTTSMKNHALTSVNSSTLDGFYKGIR